MYRRTLHKCLKRYQALGELQIKEGCKGSVKLTDYIYTHSVDKLQSEYPIYVCPHSKFPHLLHFSFKVSKIPRFSLKEFHTEVEMNEILDESTGSLILDTKDSRIISYAFPKIYNYFDKRAPVIDWNSGTTLILYVID